MGKTEINLKVLYLDLDKIIKIIAAQTRILLRRPPLSVMAAVVVPPQPGSLAVEIYFYLRPPHRSDWSEADLASDWSVTHNTSLSLGESEAGYTRSSGQPVQASSSSTPSQ